MSKILSYLNPINWLAKIAGPKVLLGILIFSFITIGWLWWSYSSAIEDVQIHKANTQEIKSALEAQKVATEQYKNNSEYLGKLLKKQMEQQEELDEKYDNIQSELDKLKNQSREEVRKCFSVELHDNLLNKLRFNPNSNKNKSESVDATN